jgi:hypothetical protein
VISILNPMPATRALAAGRIALGMGLLVAPDLAARSWFGRTDAGLRLTLRSIGARGVALGAGLLLAAEDARPWLLAGIGADVVDAAAATAAAGDLPPAKIVPGAVLAVAFAAVGAWAARTA